VFDSYSEIFEERGQLYHRAMVEQPRARDQEFENIVEFARLAPGQRVCDAPSGGGYLRPYAPSGVRVVSLETSSVFAHLARGNRAPNPVLATLERLPFQDESLDRIVSAAALHHVEDKPAFHHEAARVLAPGGALCVADVMADSAVAGFLDVFVDRHNRMGHAGMYVDDGYPKLLEEAGLRVEQEARIAFVWTFETPDAMAGFAQLLFGIDQASVAEVRGGIEQHLGWDSVGGRCEMPWELAFFRAVKA
jgi:SAM-dependent methyltransferase